MGRVPSCPKVPKMPYYSRKTLSPRQIQKDLVRQAEVQQTWNMRFLPQYAWTQPRPQDLQKLQEILDAFEVAQHQAAKWRTFKIL